MQVLSKVTPVLVPYRIAGLQSVLPFCLGTNRSHKETSELTPGSESESAARFVAGLLVGECVLPGERRGISVAEMRARSAFLALLGLQHAFLSGYFRLQRAERWLYERASRKRRKGGGRSVRHLELERQRLGREL